MDNDVVRIYNEVLLGIKKNASESVLMRWMNLEPIIQSEVSHKNKYTISMHIWNLERWYWWNNLQGSNRDTDMKNRLVAGRSQDGGGIGRGDERTFECWANFTKQLLTASRRHQVPRKAAHHLQKEHDWTSEPRDHFHLPVSGWKLDTEETGKQKPNKQREPLQKGTVQQIKTPVENTDYTRRGL